jgi:hypothetical protein
MDPGVVGGLIGLGIMVCGVGSFSIYDRWEPIKKKWKNLFCKDAQPPIPIKKENPILVRRVSKQWKVKEIIVSK